MKAAPNVEGIRRYKEMMYNISKNIFPNLFSDELREAIDYSVNKRFKDSSCKLVNNYTKRSVDILLSEFTDFINERDPIMTPCGVMFKRHGTVPNPLSKMIEIFMDNRGIHKKEMFKYPKGSEMFEKFNLLQLLDKIDCNGIYGVLAQCQAMFYNIFVAESITTTGQELISSATMFFESFLANNVKFASLEEVLWFIDCVVSEKNDRKFKDSDILDSNISKEECFYKIVMTIGDFRYGTIKWLPDEMDLQIIWDVISRLDQEDINRLYFKNNLYNFMDNNVMRNALIIILQKLNEPFMDPNEPPEEIRVELDTFVELLKEFVYFKYQYMDRVDRCDNMIKCIAGISDTDSAIISLDAWFRYSMDICKGHKFKILQEYENPIFHDEDESWNPLYHLDDIEDYDFTNDEIVMTRRLINPIEQIPEDNIRYSLINIMAYTVGTLVNDYMVEYTKSCGSYSDDRKCLIYMKNEFLFRRALLTMNKKNYASKQELQEGNIVPEEESMDIKGLPIKKSTLNKRIQDELSKILYEEILNTPVIDQVNIIKRFAILEKKMYNSLHSGEKEFYKPVTIKSINHYDDPMRIQGVKAAIIWNHLKDEELEGFDLSSRNSMDIVKVIISEKEALKIKDTYPETYNKIISCLNDPEIFPPKYATDGSSKKIIPVITSLAIPLDVAVPKWAVEFIDYKTIISDNISNFPLESVNISTFGNPNIVYSNIMPI